MEECKRMGIKVLGPDVNESKSKFTVNKDGAIRFGLAAIKGAGKGAVEEIIIERIKSGEYLDFFEFAERLSSKSVNKKTYEVLAQSGGFDGFEGYHRRQYLDSTEGLSLIESALKYASKKQADTNSNQQSLFGSSEIYASTKPKAPDCEPFSDLEQLNLEKEVVGLFISGHPLDQFRLELEFFCTCGIANTKEFKNKDISIGGMVTAVKEGTTKNGKPYGVLTIQDFTGTVELFLMGEQLLNNKSYFQNGLYVFVKGKVELDYRKAKEIKENNSIIPTDEDFGFKAISFSLLSELREKNCKSIDISVDLEDLNEKLIHEIVTLFEDNPGKCGLNFTVKSTKNNLSLNMMSRKYRVSSENNFFKSLDEISELNYKISV